MCNWLSLGVITLRNTLVKFLIISLLKTSPGTMLNNKLLITLVETDSFAILVLHHSASDGVLLIILGDKCAFVSGFKVSLLTLSVFFCLALTHFFGDLHHNLLLLQVVLLSESGKSIGGINSSAKSIRSLGHWLIMQLSIYSLGSVVIWLIRVNGLLKVAVALGDVLTNDRSKEIKVKMSKNKPGWPKIGEILTFQRQ